MRLATREYAMDEVVAAHEPAPVAGWRAALRPTLRNRLVVFGAILVFALVTLAVFARAIAPYDPTEMKVVDALKAPSWAHPFGTDRFGRDVLSRTIYGSRIAIGAMLGPGLDNAVLAIAGVYAPLFSRVARGSVIAERAKDHVVAALGLGAGASRIVLRHILPNIAAPLIVQASVSLAYAILTEASLSYLGLGTQPPDPSWGTMLNEGRTYLETAPWMSIFPGLAIMLAVLAFNLCGDGLRSVLDPQLRGR